MVIEWIIDIMLSILEAFLALFSDLPDFVDFTPPTVAVPVPLSDATPGFVADDQVLYMLNEFFRLGFIIVAALYIGRLLQWVYTQFPFKAS